MVALEAGRSCICLQPPRWEPLLANGCVPCQPCSGDVPRSWWDNTAIFSMREPVIPEFLYLAGNQLTGSGV